MKKYILSIDQGTTGTTALLVEKDTLEVVDKFNKEFPQIYPKPGWVEHDLNDIWLSVAESIKAVLDKNNIDKNSIHSIGITNQRETTCAYTHDGVPLANAIVWQDRRTADYCNNKKANYSQLQNKTGLPLDPYFSGTKMKWLIDNDSNVQDALNKNDLRLSTIDTFLLYKMTGNTSFATEPSNASRTLLMDLDTCEWSDELLSFFELQKSYLPEIKDSFSNFGETLGLDFLPDGIPIRCILGDQQAALFGQAGYKKGELKCTYGTGAFILLNTGEDKVYSSKGLLTTVAYRHKNKTYYALEGSSYIAGAAVQWLRDNLKMIDTAPEVEKLCSKIKDRETELEHLVFMPFFTGIGSPYWNPNAKAAILGITRDTKNEHIAAACLEGMALSINDSIKALIADSPKEVNSIKVDGGACLNNYLMQLQADFSEATIVRPKVIETTAYGVALGALIGANDIEIEELDKLWRSDQTFESKPSNYTKNKLDKWDNYIKKLFC